MEQIHQFEILGDQVQVHLQGELCGDRAAVFREKTLRYLEQGYQDFAVHLTQVNEINSTGLGALINLQKRIHQNGGQVVLYGLQGNVWTAFQRTRLHKAFQISALPPA